MARRIIRTFLSDKQEELSAIVTQIKSPLAILRLRGMRKKKPLRMIEAALCDCYQPGRPTGLRDRDACEFHRAVRVVHRVRG